MTYVAEAAEVQETSARKDPGFAVVQRQTEGQDEGADR